MVLRMKKVLKEQRGLTLIELLAVVVILGIIAAIAVPAIGGLIDNSKRDATAANGVQMVNSAKLYLAARNNATYPQDITLKQLYDDAQLETMKDPFNDNKDYTAESKVVVARNGNQYTYTVTLKGENGKTYLDGVELNNINRDAVNIK